MLTSNTVNANNITHLNKNFKTVKNVKEKTFENKGRRGIKYAVALSHL